MSELFMIPLDYGGYTIDKSLNYLRRYNNEEDIGKDIGVYIGGGSKKIVVDTGSPEQERILKLHPYSKPLPMQPEQGVEAQLNKAGISPEEVEIVILTHLHWDHTGGVENFPNARFIVSKEELRFALDPPPCLYLAYEALQMGLKPDILKVIDRVKTINMFEKPIIEGVKIIPLPGHTPGSLGIVVETKKGPHVITGDAVPHYGNLIGSSEEGLPYLMSGIYTDMVSMWNSFELIDEIVGGDYSKVIPGHDPLVFDRKMYP